MLFLNNRFHDLFDCVSVIVDKNNFAPNKEPAKRSPSFFLTQLTAPGVSEDEFGQNSLISRVYHLITY